MFLQLIQLFEYFHHHKMPHFTFKIVSETYEKSFRNNDVRVKIGQK